MLNKLLYREDVLDFIKQLNNSERYFNKTGRFIADTDCMTTKKELALYIFYDALFKFQILIINEGLFSEYLEQLERLYRKLDNFDDIRLGVNKAITRMIIIQLGIKKIDSEDKKNDIIKYVYNKYLINGYYFHGYSSYYSETIKKDGFNPEEYENYYDRFIVANDILKKYNCPLIEKDFNDKRVSFTDDLVMGCYYAAHGPMYFSQMLSNEKVLGNRNQQDYYLIQDYTSLSSYLKRFMDNKNMSKKDEKFILDLVQDEWNLLHSKPLKICILLAKRELIGNEIPSLEEVINNSLDDTDIYESIDRLLTAKQNSILYGNKIDFVNAQFLDFNYSFMPKNKEKKKVHEDKEEEELDVFEQDLLNAYGKASFLLIFGALFVTLGVIISIIIILQGGNI